MVASPLKVLSIYDSFFLGGARLLHSHVVEELQLSGQEHSVLSLTDRVRRENSLQLADQSIPWRNLQSAGVELSALRREAGDPYSEEHRAIILRAVDEADLVLVLKEQALEGLEQIAVPPGKPVLLSLHRSDPENQGRGPQAIFDALELGQLTGAICCADSTGESYAAAGVPRDVLHVVQNGIDLDHFRHRPEARERLRAELSIPADAPTVLIAARYDAMKNIPLFLESASEFLKLQPAAHFVLCGTGMDSANGALTGLIAELFEAEERDRLHLLGPRGDMEQLHSVADLISLTSAFGEAAPLCLLEGMASGSIPLATAIGDCARIVGDSRLITGFDSSEIAAAWSAAWEARDEHRARIAEGRHLLSDEHMVECYRVLIEEAVAGEPLDC